LNLGQRSSFGNKRRRLFNQTGVPQGSALGPLLFCLYITPLSRVIRAHGINYHQYADDMQIYIAVSKSDCQFKLTQLETCMASVHAWLQMNGLQLNPNKCEVIQFTATRGHNRVEDVTLLQVSNTAIEPSLTIKSLGVILDTKLPFDVHVTNVCRLCYGCVMFVHHCLTMLHELSPAASSSQGSTTATLCSLVHQSLI